MRNPVGRMAVILPIDTDAGGNDPFLPAPGRKEDSRAVLAVWTGNSNRGVAGSILFSPWREGPGLSVEAAISWGQWLNCRQL